MQWVRLGQPAAFLLMICALTSCHFFGKVSTDTAPPEVIKRECTSVLISLKVDGQPQQGLLIALSSDGTVTRSGAGRDAERDALDRDVFIGLSGDRLFEKFMETVPVGALEHQGRHDLPGGEGSPSELSITFFLGKDGRRKASLEFKYGSESEGPPGEVTRMVDSAVEITDSWYRDQKRMVKPE